MSLIRSFVLVAFGFWLGLTYVEPGRGWDVAARLGRGLIWAGENLADMAQARANHAGIRALHASRSRRAFFG